jgi:hypothetical protein
MQRTIGTVNFSEVILDPSLAEGACNLYLANHPEQLLLAFVLTESNTWLRDQVSSVDPEASGVVLSRVQGSLQESGHYAR